MTSNVFKSLKKYYMLLLTREPIHFLKEQTIVPSFFDPEKRIIY